MDHFGERCEVDNSLSKSRIFAGPSGCRIKVGVLAKHFYAIGIPWQFTDKLVLGLPRIYR